MRWLKSTGLLLILSSMMVFSFGCKSSSQDPPQSKQLPARCLTSDVYQISVPMQYGQSPQFTYRYQLKSVPTPGAPYVIFIPGGPGGLSIGGGPVSVSPTMLLANFNAIYTDPRGEGCNQSLGDAYPKEMFSSEYVARDILSIVQHLGLTNYILYGQSYGTIPATMAASIAEQEAITPPKAVVLEGILGRAFPGGFAQHFGGYASEWERVKTLLDPGAPPLFSANPLPLGYSSKEWEKFIQSNLAIGDIPGSGNILKSLLDPLVSSDPAVKANGEAAIRQRMDAYASHEGSQSWLNPMIYCQEHTGQLHSNLDLVGGALVSSNDVCGELGIPSFAKKYDSAAWPITTAPIFYFEGEYDCATPLDAVAAYHYYNQTQTTRYFAYVYGAGHVPMGISMATKGCTDAIWDAIAYDPNNLASALTSCGLLISLTTGTPSP